MSAVCRMFELCVVAIVCNCSIWFGVFNPWGPFLFVSMRIWMHFCGRTSSPVAPYGWKMPPKKKVEEELGNFLGYHYSSNFIWSSMMLDDRGIVFWNVVALILAGGRGTMDAWKMVSGIESGLGWHAEPWSNNFFSSVALTADLSFCNISHPTRLKSGTLARVPSTTLWVARLTVDHLSPLLSWSRTRMMLTVETIQNEMKWIILNHPLVQKNLYHFIPARVVFFCSFQMVKKKDVLYESLGLHDVPELMKKIEVQKCILNIKQRVVQVYYIISLTHIHP